MQARWLGRSVIVAVMAATVFLVAGTGRGWLLQNAHARVARKICQQVAAMPERQAARLVSRLAQEDDQWLEVIVRATADQRHLVSTTAESSLSELVDRWVGAPPETSSPRVAELARLAAQHAPTLSPDRRHGLHALGLRLIAWPVDGHLVDAGSFISDCESILALPVAEPEEVRVAAASAPAPATSPPIANEPTPAPVIVEASPSPPLSKPAHDPKEPGRFVPARGMRISDE